MTRKSGRGALVAAGLGWGAALGLALGALVVAPAIDDARGGAAPEQQPEARDTRAEETEARADAASDLLAQESEKLVAGTLKGSAVVVLRAPDAEPADVDRVRRLLDAAGADNAGELDLTEKFTSQEGADELSSVVANTLPAGTQLSVENRSPGTHAGESLSAALFTDAAGQPRATPEDRDFVLGTLADAGFISRPDAGLMAADAAVLVTGPAAADGDGPTFADGVLADLAAALQGQMAPVVVASPDSGRDGGIAAALSGRGGDSVPYRGVVDTDAGAVLTVRDVRAAIDARQG